MAAYDVEAGSYCVIWEGNLLDANSAIEAMPCLFVWGKLYYHIRILSYKYGNIIVINFFFQHVVIISRMHEHVNTCTCLIVTSSHTFACYWLCSLLRAILGPFVLYQEDWVLLLTTPVL